MRHSLKTLPLVPKVLGLLGNTTYILLGAKIRFVPGFNFNQKVFFHVFILEEGREEKPPYSVQAAESQAARSFQLGLPQSLT